MSFKSFEQNSAEQEREKAFEELIVDFDSNREQSEGYIRYELPYPKEQFLNYLTQKKKFLLHGSSRRLEALKPQQANDGEKAFGNKIGVYAVEDPVLPIFYAIQDRAKIHGYVVSHKLTATSYYFEMPKEILAQKPWKDGVVYILTREKFEQGHNDNGDPIDEWASTEAVEPWARLEVAPSDFRFLDEIKELKT